MIINDFGLKLEVEFVVYAGYPDTREEPGEPGYLEITAVRYNGQEIEMTESDLDRIADMLYEQGVIDDDGY
jgi:hypothetical protein